MRKTVLIAILTLGFLITPFLAHPEVYKWVDEKGTVHFTDDHSRIPEKYGPQVERRPLLEESKPIIEEKKIESKTTENPLPSPVDQGTPLLFSGRISTVGAGMIFVTGEAKDMVFLVSEDTSIKTDYAQKASFSDLKNGRPVTVEYIKEGGDNHARSIKVSLLLAATPNVAEENVENAPGKYENAGEAQRRVWEKQKRFKKPKK